jgi:hypothetical protein
LTNAVSVAAAGKVMLCTGPGVISGASLYSAAFPSTRFANYRRLRANLVVDFPLRKKECVRLLRFAARCQGPHEPLLRIPILGHRHTEDKLVAGRQKVRRLPLIGPAGSIVFRTNRDVDDFFVVAVVIENTMAIVPSA